MQRSWPIFETLKNILQSLDKLKLLTTNARLNTVNFLLKIPI